MFDFIMKINRGEERAMQKHSTILFTKKIKICLKIIDIA